VASIMSKCEREGLWWMEKPSGSRFAFRGREGGGGGDQQQTMLLITIKSIKLIELKYKFTVPL